jgi:hypothetical protein
MAILKNTTIDDTAAIRLPVGLATQRPSSPSIGQLRYNSLFNQPEIWSGSAWSYVPDIARDSLDLRLDAGEPTSYPGTGTTWFDISGNNRNLTLSSALSYSNSPGFFTFGGSDTAFRAGFYGTDLIGVLPSSTSNYNLNATYESWVFPTTLDATARHIWTDSNFNEGELEFYNNQIRAYWGGSTSAIFSDTISPNQWYHVVQTHQKDDSMNLYKMGLYINGVKVASSAAQLISSSASSYGPDGQLNVGYFWIGRISTFSIYSRVLTPQEIQGNFNALRSRYGI